jgi:hypothetical protein
MEDADESEQQHDLPPLLRDVVLVLWCSFLAASAAITVFFAFVDPAQLPVEPIPMFWQTRPARYALGFFLFWGMAALAAALTLYMVRTESVPRARD